MVQPERRPVVLIAEELAPSALEVLSAEFEIRHVDGADRAALLPALADVDAVLIRSATRIDAEALAARRPAQGRRPGRHRAGQRRRARGHRPRRHGRQRADRPTSSPPPSTRSRCCSRSPGNVPAANCVAAAGEWKRVRFTGVELADKTVGVVGLGRIGQLVAQRLAAFGVRLIAYDPYVQPARAAQIGVRLVDLDELLAQSDFISIHLPKTPETLGLIGAARAGRGQAGRADRQRRPRRPGATRRRWPTRCRSGQVAGAGIDVYVTEPATDSPLFGLPGVVVTPHLGASTVEAQDKAGLGGGPVGPARAARRVRPGRGERAGRRHGRARTSGRGCRWPRSSAGCSPRLAGGVPSSITVEVRGEIIEHDVTCCSWPRSRACSPTWSSEQVTFVNAPLLAEERGVDVGLATYAGERRLPQPRHRARRAARRRDGERVRHAVRPEAGGEADRGRRLDVDLRLEGHLLFFRYTDRPGVVGVVGALLGEPP